MKLWSYIRPTQSHLIIWLAGAFLGIVAGQSPAADSPAGTQAYQPTEDEFSTVAKAVAELLHDRDVTRFATNLTISLEDYRSVLPTNGLAGGEDPSKNKAAAVAFQRHKLEASATALLAKAGSLHVNFSQGDWHPRVILPRKILKTPLDAQHPAGARLPFTDKLELVFNPQGGDGTATNDDFKLVVRGLQKFPGGWRTYDGIQWESFPATVADEKTRHEMVVLDKIAGSKAITEQDDPPLLKFGETMVRFVREGDAAFCQSNALVTADLIWEQLQKDGRTGPTRQGVADSMKDQVQDLTDQARSLLTQMADEGIDLKNADIQIKSVEIKRVQSGAPGSLDGLMGQKCSVILAVKSEGKAKNGVSLSGDYELAASQMMRLGDDWRIMSGLHWQQFPPGVLDAAAADHLKFENYVAEHGTLPPGSTAPEISFTTLAGDQKMKLSDLRGKVVVLDFWATWCGPCQEPMAELQKIRQGHADWQDQVAIVPLSIDDAPDTALKHVDKRGWTNTFNVWAGAGGWHCDPIKMFRVTGVPTTYIIDAQGKIAAAGHPASLKIADKVDGLLKR